MFCLHILKKGLEVKKNKYLHLPLAGANIGAKMLL